MNLERYWEKRDFRKTPEPRGRVEKAQDRLSYFIQRHDARRLHYDFRLELDGTLKSWAIPKGPSLDPKDKRLAVHVEDHPLSYGPFEGEIPEGQYGAGSVLLWDRGHWTCEGDPGKGYRKGHLKFRLDGEKLSGNWALVRMDSSERGKDNWLLIKEHDEYSASGPEANITELRPESVADHDGGKSRSKASTKGAGRTESTVRAKKQGAHEPTPKQPALKLDRIEHAEKGAMPAAIKPQLATLVARPPEGEEWLSEVKFDGYRALCRVEKSTAQLFTRAGHDWTKKWQALADAAARLPLKQAWLDGEVVALTDEGAVSFHLLQNAARHGEKVRLAYYLFDLLYLDGVDLRQVALHERKRLLKSLLQDADRSGPLLYSDHIEGKAPEVFSHACMHELEGIIAKRADSGYIERRSASWLKVKCHRRQEFVVGGYTEPAGAREKFGALLLGVYDANRLRYAGKVGTGFTEDTLAIMSDKFARLGTKTSPFSNPGAVPRGSGVHWLKPELVAEVRFGEWTDAGVIRHAAFIGLRADKPAREIKREMPEPAAAQEPPAPTKSKDAKTMGAKTTGTKTMGTTSGADHAMIAGVTLSHPSRVLFAESGLTKFDLAQYYEHVSEWILPHLKQRPLTLVRCPNGGGEKCFFQKHATEATSVEIDRVEVPDGAGSATYLMANSLPSLISLVQMGVLELHTWGATCKDLQRPDRMIFDLDPAPEVGWPQIVEGAQLVKALLDEIGLVSFVKTTGGKGLHVVVPLKPEKPWDEVKAFSRAIAEHLAATLPAQFTANLSKKKRTGKIFIDYLRNAMEATAVAAYSTRARPNASVATPVRWEELTPELRPDTFTVTNIGARLQQLKEDPWQEFFTLKQRLTKKMTDAFGPS